MLLTALEFQFFLIPRSKLSHMSRYALMGLLFVNLYLIHFWTFSIIFSTKYSFPCNILWVTSVRLFNPSARKLVNMEDFRDRSNQATASPQNKSSHTKKYLITNDHSQSHLHFLKKRWSEINVEKNK